MDKVRVVLIEDHDLTRVGLRTALQQHGPIEIVGEAATGRQGLQVIQDTQPDVAIVDIGLPDIDGIELTSQLKQTTAPAGANTEVADTETAHTIKVLILTMHDNDEAVLAAFAAGADSYSVKDVGIDKLVEAVQATYEGNAWIDPAIARIVLKQAQIQHTSGQVAVAEEPSPAYEKILESDPLTEREMEVLELIVDGYSNADIAKELYITIGTVKTHVRNILSKLSAADRTQAAVRALRSGLVSL
ncbi:MAG: response regulator transcription factor [Synechococcales bacterium]|nr:response regulator transcription factor [Synechococcales bacterium]